MTCGICKRQQEDGFKTIQCNGIHTVEKCPTNEVPKLSKENQKFWFLFTRMMPGFYSGMGGFDFNIIDIVFNLYHIPDGQRPIIYDKCMYVLDVIFRMRKEKNEN